MSLMDLEHGLLLGFIGCTVTIIGFTIAYMIAMYNHKKQNKKEETNPLKDYLKSMQVGWKGDDCE